MAPNKKEQDGSTIVRFHNKSRIDIPDMPIRTVHLTDVIWDDILTFCKLGLSPDRSEFIRSAIVEKVRATWDALYHKQQIQMAQRLLKEDKV